MSPKIGLPYVLNQVRVPVEGLQMGAPKCSARGSSSLHLHGGSSLGQSGSASHPGECCHLALGECVAVVDLLGLQGEGMGSLNLMVSGKVSMRRLVRDMFPVSKCMGYISFPRASLGQAWRAPQQACRKDWWACFFHLKGLIFQVPHGFLVNLL